ncbi:hypothetical protein NDU88_005480 [Pleurodeles waltl]|uniref:Uncharacterized protein n=1 Tax=Pleurodeles waltl TaxID=8319 RepID=A0AAV7SLX4_PLEWA|nr:hypothetical protein NDU88_005480 [Pleurodeles waltl]
MRRRVHGLGYFFPSTSPEMVASADTHLIKSIQASHLECGDNTISDVNNQRHTLNGFISPSPKCFAPSKRPIQSQLRYFTKEAPEENFENQSNVVRKREY